MHEHQAQYLVGLDVGSTTVKAVVVDAATDQIIWQDYQRHDTRQPEKTLDFLRRMEAEAPRVKVTFRVGERVRIVDGPFNDFRGTVAEIDMERSKVRVMVNFFGRETPVELDFLQVEKA